MWQQNVDEPNIEQFDDALVCEKKTNYNITINITAKI